MPVWESLLIFIVITLLMILCFYVVRPYLEQLGVNEYTAYPLSLSIVGVVMLVWTFMAIRREGNLTNLETFLNRLRLKGFKPGMLGWSVGLGLLMFLSTVIFSPVISKGISDLLLSLSPDRAMGPCRCASPLETGGRKIYNSDIYYLINRDRDNEPLPYRIASHG